MRPLVVLAAFLSACNGPAEPSLDDNLGVNETEGTPGCDNLLLVDCLLPFPSDAYVTEGEGLALPAVGMPIDQRGRPFGTEAFAEHDAYGTASPVLFRLPGAVVEQLTVFDPEPSLAPDSRTVLVDATTGERIPHWLETDYLTEGAEPTLWTLRPSVPLPRGHTVVVGLRGFRDADGAILAAPAPFVALRDRQASRWLGVHGRRDHFERVVFPTLEAAGVPREELQLAWSFPVETTEAATTPMLEVRDAVFDALPPEGPDYRIEQILVCDGAPDPEGCDASIRVIVDAVVEVPSVLVEADALGVRRVRRGEDGRPVVDGVEEWPFRLQLPHSAFEGDGPVPVMQYGHGFMGSQDEANNGWLRDMADRLGFAVVATSMQGMSGDDALVWTSVLLSEGGRFPYLQDKAMQGVANQLVIQRLMATTLADDVSPELRRADGQLAWDPDTLWYYGNSQGGSVGSVVMGTTLDVQRGVLGVPGSAYPLLLQRSTVFTELVDLLRASWPAPDAVSVFLTLLGTGWDAFDPLTFAPHHHGDPLPGTPDHEVLLHVAKEDQQVHNELSFQLGRASGAVLMTPAVRPVWGLSEQAYPASPGAALVEVDFSIPDDPDPLDPPPERPELESGGDTHGWLRAWEPAQDQMVHFLATGEVIDVCGGEACVVDGRP